MTHQNRIQTSYINQNRSGSKMHVTRLDQDLDDFHVTIQSSKPILQQNAISIHNQKKLQYQRSNYYIEIDEEDGTDIDLTVKVGKQAYTAEIRNNHVHFPERNSFLIKETNMDERYLTSRIAITEEGPERNYHVNYVSEPGFIYKNDYNTNKKYGPTKYEETKQIIKIIDGQRQPNIDNGVSKWKTERVYESHNLNKNNQADQESPDRASKNYSFKGERDEKAFGSLSEYSKLNKEGRIIKNKNYDFSNEEELYQSVNQAKNNVPHSFKIEPNTQVHTPQIRSPKEGDHQIKQFSTQQKTPSRNYMTNSTESPSIYPYKEYSNKDEVDTPGFSGSNAKERRRPKIFKKNEQNRKQPDQSHEHSRQEEPDKERKPPEPFDRRNIGEKDNQDSINPPSVKDIPSTEHRRQRIHTLNDRYRGSFQNQERDEPIIVPIQKLPKRFSKNDKSSRTEKIDENNPISQLNERQKHRHSTSGTYRDLFFINKHKYLQKLRGHDRSKSKPLLTNRTFSKSSRHSLSPQCSIITNRLHSSRINKQPCPRYQHYLETMKRIQTKETLCEYTFIRRYMNDKEIYEVLEQLQRAGIPQKKWAMRLVDIVYDKLRVLKAN